MKRLLSAAIASLALTSGGVANAGAFADTITDNYWGSDAHGLKDVIGDTNVYDINSAKITRVKDVLTITINTKFAGKAKSDPWAYTENNVAKGIGYGDVFLSDTWNPVGTVGDHYAADNASNSTIWDYGFSLNDRWNNNGGSFTLYKLNGKTNALNTKNSESYINCTNNCLYRNGQEVAVNTAANNLANVSNTGKTGSWTVVNGQSLQFTINVSGTDLATFSSLAMHWGETCQNDVIEGIVRLTPLPGTLPLLALGLAGLVVMRRRRQS
ncbi:MAG: PEP-CTERM sorting domain-containing protein [Burkholderiaceae bacterium]|nr:PEP-CTERM sorting domain-containing protein [Burkholderiaceae bacterium]